MAINNNARLFKQMFSKDNDNWDNIKLCDVFVLPGKVGEILEFK